MRHPLQHRDVEHDDAREVLRRTAAGYSRSSRRRREVADRLQALIWLAVPVWGPPLLLWRAVPYVSAGIGMVLETLRGEHRAAWAPAWLLAAALATSPWPSLAWVWVILALPLDAIPERVWARLHRPFLSERERELVALAFARVALVQAWPMLFSALPWLIRAALLSSVVLVAALPWWRGRELRDEPDLPPILRRWEDEVVAEEPRLAGDWIDPDAEPGDPDATGPQHFDAERGTGVYRLHNETASEAAQLDEWVEWLLEQRAGTVTISADPRLTRRCVRITFTEPGQGGRMRWWEGPSLQRDGRFVAAYTPGGMPIYGRLWHDGGGACIALIGPPGAGKGGLTRVIVLEGAGSPEMEIFGICGKYGQGLGYLRGGMHSLATKPEEWVPQMRRYQALGQYRMESGGGRDEDSYEWRPGNPRAMLVVDELPEVLKHGGREVVTMLEFITGRQRSVGMGLVVAAQGGNGDREGLGSTRVRSNIYDNGWLGSGRATDAQQKSTVLQGFRFDLRSLPDQPGHLGIMGSILGQPPLGGRVLWVPNAQDVRKRMNVHGDTYDEACQFGEVEEWLARDTVHPEFEAGQAEVLAADYSNAKGGVSPAPARMLTLVPAPEDDAGPAPAGGKARVLKVLEKHYAERRAAGEPEEGDGLLRGVIAQLAGVVPRHATELLNQLRDDDGKAVRNDNSTWRLAA